MCGRVRANIGLVRSHRILTSGIFVIRIPEMPSNLSGPGDLIIRNPCSHMNKPQD